jgi:branched-subunit amino acid permease
MRTTVGRGIFGSFSSFSAPLPQRSFVFFHLIVVVVVVVVVGQNTAVDRIGKIIHQLLVVVFVVVGVAKRSNWTQTTFGDLMR